MVKIVSNVAQMRALLENSIRGWQTRAVVRMRTEIPFRQTAQAALALVMSQEERPFMALILDGITKVDAAKDAVRLNVALPASLLQGAEAAGRELRRSQSALRGRPRAGETQRDRELRVYQREADLEAAMANAEAAVRAWVYAPYTGRDDPASGKDINAQDLARGGEVEPREATVQALLRILGVVPISPAEQNSAERQSAAVRLMRRIESFVEAQLGQGTPLASTVGGAAAPGGPGGPSGPAIAFTAERANRWVGAVFAAWTELVLDRVPKIVAEEILKGVDRAK